MLNFLTNGAIPTDNVGDDNGLRVTDGSVDPVSGKTRAIAFPYIGAPNSAPGGPNPGGPRSPRVCSSPEEVRGLEYGTIGFLSRRRLRVEPCHGQRFFARCRSE